MSAPHPPAVANLVQRLHEAAAQKLICDETSNQHADAMHELGEARAAAVHLAAEFDTALFGAVEFLSSRTAWRSEDEKSEADAVNDLIDLARQVAQAKSEYALAWEKEKAAREGLIDFQRSKALLRLDEAKVEMLVSFGAPHPYVELHR